MPRFPIIPQDHRKIIEYPMDSAAVFEKGAAVLLASDEEVEECGADPAAIRGFAAHPAAGRDILPTKCLVAVAESGCTFIGTGSSDPDNNDVNQLYGLAKDSDNIWYVDKTDTSNTRVEVVNVDLLRKLFIFTVLVANRQIEV